MCCYAQSKHSKISIQQQEFEAWKLPYNHEALNVKKQTTKKGTGLVQLQGSTKQNMGTEPTSLKPWEIQRKKIHLNLDNGHLD